MVPRLVVGLGNPGEDYALTRHNVGYRVVDELARRHGGVRWRRGCSSLLGRTADGIPPWLAKPETFMNLSGRAVSELLATLGITVTELLVVVDDVDLPLGRLRLRRSGGPGTHNGLRDIVDAVGAGFPRLRVGVRGTTPWDDLAAYVLSPFDPDEVAAAEDAVIRAADAVEAVWADGFERAMETVNRASAAPQVKSEE